jgi:hypothetical protein
VADETVDPLFHFVRRLVGEGQSEETLRPNTRRQEVCRTIGEDPRLPAAGTGNNHHRPGNGGRCGTLYGVEFIQEGHAR